MHCRHIYIYHLSIITRAVRHIHTPLIICGVSCTHCIKNIYHSSHVPCMECIYTYTYEPISTTICSAHNIEIYTHSLPSRYAMCHAYIYLSTTTCAMRHVCTYIIYHLLHLPHIIYMYHSIICAICHVSIYIYIDR